MSFPIDKREITTLSQYFLLQFGRLLCSWLLCPTTTMLKTALLIAVNNFFMKYYIYHTGKRLIHNYIK